MFESYPGETIALLTRIAEALEGIKAEIQGIQTDVGKGPGQVWAVRAVAYDD